MDEQSKAVLAEITAKEPAALTESDVAFLRARRSYLTERELDVFAEVIGQPAEEAKADEAPKAKPFKKMNRAELEAELASREITFVAEAKNPELVALLEEFEADKAKADEAES